MRRTLLVITLLAAAASSAFAQSSAPAAQPSVQLPPGLERVLRDYEARFRIGGDTLAALFAEDGFVLAGGRPPIRGRSAIASYYGRPGGPLSLRAIAYDTAADIGYIIGGYRYQPQTEDQGKFTLVLRRDADGRWLIYSDMDNSNASPRRP
jgi:ketosteroid isomerase-like protein